MSRHFLTVLVLAYLVQILNALDTVDEKDTVQVVKLVVNDYGVKAIEDPIKSPPVFVQSHHAQVMRAHGLAVEAGKTETAIVTIQPKGGTHLFQAKNGDFAFPTVISGVKVHPT